MNSDYINVFHYSRHGNDILNFDNYDDSLHIFDAVGVHVGNLKSSSELFERWKNRGSNGGVMYPLKLHGAKYPLNESGSIMSEVEVHKFLEEIKITILESNNYLSNGKDINPLIRKLIWRKYDYIPYINDVEGKGEISYICPAESLSFKISPNTKTFGNKIPENTENLDGFILGFHYSNNGAIKSGSFSSNPETCLGTIVNIQNKPSPKNNYVHKCKVKLNNPYYMSQNEFELLNTSFKSFKRNEELVDIGHDGIILVGKDKEDVRKVFVFNRDKVKIVSTNKLKNNKHINN